MLPDVFMRVKIMSGLPRGSDSGVIQVTRATVVTGRGGRRRASIASHDTILALGKGRGTMGSAWHEVSALGRPATRWGSLLAMLLVAACGGDRDAAPAGDEEA